MPESLADPSRIIATCFLRPHIRRQVKRITSRVPYILILGLWLSLGSISAAQGTSTLHDPLGDTFGAARIVHDIVSIDGLLTDASVTFVVEVREPISSPSQFGPNSLVGFIDLDLDRDVDTGSQSNTDRFALPESNALGSERYLDLFSERFHPGRVELIDTTSLQPLGLVPIVYGERAASVSVPFELLDGMRRLNYTVIVGDFVSMSDKAPNLGPATTVPEPGAFPLMLTALLSSFASVRRSTHSRVR